MQVQVSLGRLGKFLKDEELRNDAIDKTQNAEYAVQMRDASLSWEPSAKKPTLRGMNLNVKHGDHVAVCGAVGSGKSTLLYSIMGEIPKVSGNVSVTYHMACTCLYLRFDKKGHFLGSWSYMLSHLLFAYNFNNIFSLVQSQRLYLNLYEFWFIEGQTHLRTFLACQNKFDP